MRGRWPLYVLLASALTFVVSLYLPWYEVRNEGMGILSVVGIGSGTADGWATTAGMAASLAAVAVVIAAAATLVRPGLFDDRLPLVPLALTLGYLGIATLVALRANEMLSQAANQLGHLHHHYSYGAYLGVASAAVALLTAAILGGARLRPRPTSVELVAGALSVGLLVAFLLPWATAAFGRSETISFPGVNSAVVVLAAAGICLLIGSSLRSGRAVYLAAAIAVLTGAAVQGLGVVDTTRIDYGAWMALGVALALVAATAFVRPQTRPALPALAGALTAAAAGVFVVALFLPWQEFCAPGGGSLGHGLGSCIATTGWTTGEPGAVAGTLALVLVLAAFVATWRTAAAAEIALAVAILTATVGVTQASSSGPLGWGFGYGAYVGFAAAGVLLLVAFARIRPPKLERGRVVDRLIPLAASAALLCAVALPGWSVLPDRWSPQVDVMQSWYATVGVVLTVHLLRRWLESAGGTSSRSEELLVLPLALLSLTALELIRERDAGVTWGGGILVGLCLVLVMFGWVEQKGGLERLRVPEILRVDRLPGAEET